MKYLLRIISIGLLFMTAAAFCQPAMEATIRKDIVYGHAGGVDLLLDLAQPQKGKGPYPAVVFFHGGGWQAGKKSDGHHWIKMLAELGYVGVTVEYRFAPAFKWPAQVQDAKASIRFLRAHAKELNIDPNRIGTMGESAGGYLASMLGVTGPADGFDGDGGNPEVSSKVKVAISFVSSFDFTLPKAKLTPEIEEVVMKYYNKTLPEVMADFMGSREPNRELLTKMSVITYVDKSDAPMIIFRGDKDPFITMEQGQRMDKALTDAGVQHELVTVPGGGHGWAGPLKEKTDQQLVGFLSLHL